MQVYVWESVCKATIMNPNINSNYFIYRMSMWCMLALILLVICQSELAAGGPEKNVKKEKVPLPKTKNPDVCMNVFSPIQLK